MSSISKSKAIILCCCDHKCILIRERRLFETAGLIWKTSAPNAIYTVQTGDVTPTHQEHESRPRLCIGNDATFVPWTFVTVHVMHPPPSPSSPLPLFFLNNRSEQCTWCRYRQIRLCECSVWVHPDQRGAVHKRLWGSVIHDCTFPLISSCCH